MLRFGLQSINKLNTKLTTRTFSSDTNWFHKLGDLLEKYNKPSTINYIKNKFANFNFDPENVQKRSIFGAIFGFCAGQYLYIQLYKLENKNSLYNERNDLVEHIVYLSLTSVATTIISTIYFAAAPVTVPFMLLITPGILIVRRFDKQLDEKKHKN